MEVPGGSVRLGSDCGAPSPLSTSGEWFCPKPPLLGMWVQDWEVPSWGHPSPSASARGFRLPPLNLICELGQHCGFPVGHEINPNSRTVSKRCPAWCVPSDPRTHTPVLEPLHSPLSDFLIRLTDFP